MAGRAADRRRATLGLAPLIVAQLIELFTELRSRGSTLLLAEERARGVLDAADQVVLYEKGSDA